MTLLERIQKLREANGNISINKLEKEAGLTRGSMAKWDIHTPGYDKLKKVADYFNVSVDYLLGISDETSAKKAPTENDERDELVDAIMTIVKQLSPEQKEMLLAQLHGLAGQK